MVPVAVIELNEPHAALGQPPGQQAVGGERAVAPLRAVQLEHVRRLVRDVHQLRHARLHAKRHFVLADARGDFRIVDRLVVQPIERLHAVDHVALLLGRDSARAADVQHRIALAAKLDALKAAGQKAAVPLPRGDRLRLAELAQRRQHDEARQVVAVAAQAVREPRAHRRPAGDRRAGVHERVGRIVIDGLGVQRADDAHLVGHLAELGKDGGDLLARLAAPLERVLRRQAGELLALQLRDRLALGERLGHRLAVHLGQLRLVVERLQVRRPAGHVEIDDALGSRREVRAD